MLLDKKEKTDDDERSAYSRETWLVLLALIVALFVIELVALSYSITILQAKIVDPQVTGTAPSNATALAFGTWFIDSTHATRNATGAMRLTPGQKVPFAVAEAVQGIEATESYTFRLPADGFYMARYQVVTIAVGPAYFYGIVINPDGTTPRFVNGSLLNSDGQKDTQAVTPNVVTFQALADDEVAVVYRADDGANSTRNATIGGGVIKGVVPSEQPIAFLQLLQLA
jgi:hypothetical protein